MPVRRARVCMRSQQGVLDDDVVSWGDDVVSSKACQI